MREGSLHVIVVLGGLLHAIAQSVKFLGYVPYRFKVTDTTGCHT